MTKCPRYLGVEKTFQTVVEQARQGALSQTYNLSKSRIINNPRPPHRPSLRLVALLPLTNVVLIGDCMGGARVNSESWGRMSIKILRVPRISIPTY